MKIPNIFKRKRQMSNATESPEVADETVTTEEDKADNLEITKEEHEETVRKAREIICEMQENALLRMPLWMRLNWFWNNMCTAYEKGYKEEDFKWDYINDMCSKNLSEFDCNLYQPVHTIEAFEKQRFNIIGATAGLGPWQVHICKDCGEEFCMNYKEVQFYKEKELNLPKRCKTCREKRKSNNG